MGTSGGSLKDNGSSEVTMETMKRKKNKKNQVATVKMERMKEAGRGGCAVEDGRGEGHVKAARRSRRRGARRRWANIYTDIYSHR